MKILYVLNKFPNISNTFITSELVELIKRGHDVNIISMSHPDELDIHAHEAITKYKLMEKTIYLSKKSVMKNMMKSPGSFLRSNNYYKMWQVKDKHLSIITNFLITNFKRENYDIVHTHFAKPQAKAALSAALSLHIPFTFTTHAFDLYDRTKKMPDPDLKTMVLHSTSAITISDYNKKHIASICGKSSLKKISIVHCGLDFNDFQLKYKNQGTRILSISRLVEKKGLDILLEAASKLKTKYKLKDLQFDIVGQGPLQGSLQKQSAKLGLKKLVKFHGAVDDNTIARLYNDSVMFALPCVIDKHGDRDGIPVTLMESMALGVPVVSTNVSGIPELIVNGETGLVVPPSNAQALAEAIYNLYNDPKLRSKLSLSGRKKVEKEFNIKSSVEKLLKIWS